MDMDQAFTLLSDNARHSNQRLADVARNFVTGTSADFRLRRARRRHSHNQGPVILPIRVPASEWVRPGPAGSGQ